MTRLSAAFILSAALGGFVAVPVIYAAATPATPSTASSTAAADLQAQIDAHNQEIAQLNQEITKYEAQIRQAETSKASLKNSINTIDLEKSKTETQIAATQTKIAGTELQIKQLETGIAGVETKIEADQAALAEDIRGIQMDDANPFIVKLISTNNLGDLWNDVDTVLEVQSAIQNHVQGLSSRKNDLADSKAATERQQALLTSQKKTLTAQRQTLIATTRRKSQLLAETNANEAQYQKLLAQAKTELASFSTFTQNAGGSGLLSKQTACDNWGCYYNQRDVAWGNDALNGTKYLLKSDGCLVTSMAMIMTHYGYRDVTPVTINSNPENFAAYYPAYLLFTIYVDGMTVTRKSSYIDATLATGNPVVVGLRAYGGTHFIVLVSGSKGKYVMRDPYIPNGDDISFSSHYSLSQVFGVAKVIISS